MNSGQSRSKKSIINSMALVAVSLFFNGFGIYLTIRADIGVGPWDVFNLGLSKSLGILYGTASILVASAILCIDIAMKEPIGIAMFIDAIVVGKSVDFFEYIDMIPCPNGIFGSVMMLFAGLVIMGYTQFFYMRAALGCGPRDTLLVGLSKRLARIPIGIISIGLLSAATFIGYLLGGPVGIGTIICTFCSGPIMQAAFKTVHFEATKIHHYGLQDTLRTLF